MATKYTDSVYLVCDRNESEYESMTRFNWYGTAMVGSMAIEYHDSFDLACAEYNDSFQLACFSVRNGSEYDRYGSVHLVCCSSKTLVSIPSSTIT